MQRLSSPCTVARSTFTSCALSPGSHDWIQGRGRWAPILPFRNQLSPRKCKEGEGKWTFFTSSSPASFFNIQKFLYVTHQCLISCSLSWNTYFDWSNKNVVTPFETTVLKTFSKYIVLKHNYINNPKCTICQTFYKNY